ncbi:MAG: SBBP repeat-containing protein [Rubricoccaceae bacterium]
MRLFLLFVLGSVLSAAHATPLRFEPNLGQSAAEVAFLARSPSSSLFLTERSAHLRAGDRMLTLCWNAEAMPEGVAPLPGLTHYLRGQDARQWVRGVPGFAAVRYPDLAPGIDLTLGAQPEGLFLSLDLTSGAALSTMAWTLDGADALTLAPDGSVLARLGTATLRLPAPTVRRAGEVMRSRFVLDGSHLRIRATRPAALSEAETPSRVLDPYTTFLGGMGDDEGLHIAVGADGATYLTGNTSSSDFPVTEGTPSGGPDVFVTKVAPDGMTLVYSVIFGGSEPDFGFGIALLGDGSVIVTGETGSPDFPTTTGAFDESFNGTIDAFAVHFNPMGDDVLYSTVLGGSGVDAARNVSVDATGAAYIVGFTSSGDFPTTSGVVMPSAAGLDDAFATKLSPSGDAIAWSTFLGGSGVDKAFDSALLDDELLVTGQTDSADLPTTTGAFDETFNGVTDAWVAHLSPAADAFAYLTYLGGQGPDMGEGIAVNDMGEAFVAGITEFDFPTTGGAAFPDSPGSEDAFLALLSPDGADLPYATYYGGNDLDFGCDVALDEMGLPVIVGKTNSLDLPITRDGPQTTFGGITDGFYARFDPALSGMPSFLNGTYIGGDKPDIAHAVAVGPDGLAVIGGFAESLDFPTTSGAFSETFNGGVKDAFVSRIPADFVAVAANPEPSETVQLSAAHPNPFSPQTTLLLTVEHPQYVHAVLTDVRGRTVARVWSGPVPVGTTALVVEGDDLPSGVYLLRVTGDGFAMTRSLTLLR